MKKFLLLIFVVALVATSVLAFAGCTSSTAVPGVAWCSSESFVYDIFDSEQDDARIGSMTYTVEILAAGEHSLSSISDKSFSVTETTRKGTLITMTATDLDGNVIMFSEAITNGTSALASYKEVNYGDTSYSFASYFEDKYCYYSIDDGEWDKVKASGAFDTVSLYNLIRSNSLIDSYSASIDVVNPVDASTESFYISTNTASDLSATIDYSTVDYGSDSISVGTYQVTLAKTDAPIGGSIIIYYSAYDSSEQDNSTSNFCAMGSLLSQTSSYHVPVQIEENNITYKLVSASFA